METTNTATTTQMQKFTGKLIEPYAEKPVKDLLFKPLTDKQNDNIVRFVSLLVPFCIKENMVFCLYYHYLTCENDIMLKCIQMDPGQPIENMQDASATIRECLHMQNRTGIPFYLNRLNSIVEKYTEILNRLIHAGILDKKTARVLLDEIGIPKDGTIY